MISDAELARLKEQCVQKYWGWEEIEYARAALPALFALIELLQHENATCAAALMIARDRWHKAEAELAELRAEVARLKGEWT